MTEPTAYSELNAVLRELVSGVETILAETFCGAYLQGSFAVGDADEHSDVDFVVVTHGELTEEQVGELQILHARIYGLDVPWAQHLEGSYAPRERLRRPDPDRAPFWYLDNGSTELVLDDHCNTAVVRWSLREHGVVLAGPDPTSLVDPVTAEGLKAEVLAAFPEWRAYARSPTRAGGMSRWLQPYLVLSLSRMLHTLAVGRVSSKREGGEWAAETLAPEWAELIRHALEDRRDPWVRTRQAADSDLVERTLAFVDYAIERGRSEAAVR